MQDRKGIMELRNCSVKHFIQTIRGGLVIKVYNIDSHGKPVTRSKILKDVYDSEDAKRTLTPPSGSVFYNKQVRRENPFFLVAARSLWEIKSEPDDFAPSVDCDSDSDLDDATTLSQLKNRLSTKKRKYASPDKNSKQDNASAKAVEDESDLNEPLINLKPKHRKATRAKRRCLNSSVISSANIEVAIKSEENLVSEGSPQARGELAPVILVKTEVPDAEQLGSQNEMPLTSSPGHIEVLNPDQSIVLHECDRERESLLYVNKYDECLTNEISYDHLEDVQPLSVLFPGNEVSIMFETLGYACKKSLVEITKLKEIPDSCSSIASCSVDPNADVSSHSNSSSVVEDMPEECSSGDQVPDMAIDGCVAPRQGSICVLFEDKAQADLPNELNESLSIPGKNYDSKLGSITSSSTEENPIFMKDSIDDEEQLSTSFLDTEDVIEGHTENELLNALDKQNSAFPLTCAENESSLEERTCDNADAISTPGQQLPERLFSTRKAFSPSSQERLCLAMNSVEIWNGPDQNIDSECKGKLFENQTAKKPSSQRSEIQYDKKSVNHTLPEQVSQPKVIISPRRVIKRSQIAKGNLEGPRFSRTLPNLSTGCTSVQGCSESAVAFSQRQMHDMESIAVKLMNELKSMKDFVEQKMLFEAYRNVSLKNDADEVKSAINNAIRAEGMAKKWMSMMARDSNRFCKIMKMMPDSTSSSKNTFSRGERKIMFADEAGGQLCHIRFFDDGSASPASNAVEQ
ncbi:hypothetical protein C2S51_016294 [Perilla frutescens var. frutescens]|nr:hypothetical protein C2S51_016294 [Perilla frutescens var. frutescens]